jgi:serine/threonine protein kinase/tetratricopeptide (TPR) repeat protein
MALRAVVPGHARAEIDRQLKHSWSDPRNIDDTHFSYQKVPLTPESPDEDFAVLEQLFDEVLALPVDQRDAFLRERCGSNTLLVERVKALLAAHDSEQVASEARQQAASEKSVPLHRRFGPYEVESLLGRGGMGAVYLAHRADGQYEKKVAIKIVDLPLATEAFFERFRQERQILAGLDHPNIARLLDGGISEDGILFLVMDYVDGTRIDAYCVAHKLDLREKLRLFLAVCGAVQFAHQNMVVHRDLKPDNVLVSEDGVPHLLDFGTARLISRDNSIETRGLTREGFLSFTPEYASPEQVLGRPVATTSDTYSLGVLLYQVLTGRLPYQLNEFTAEEMIHIICERAADRPTSLDGTFLDADLEAILGKALRKETDERYATADQFAADVQAYVDNKPVLARKGNLRYRTVKFARRNRLAIAFATVLVATVIAGVAGVLWQARAARLAEQSAEASANDLSRLSDTLLSELDDAIKQLPGSTGAQQVLVARVLEHLDRMSHTYRTNAVTQVSLVNAFVRLANLQANPYEQNLGDKAGALNSLSKAMAIAEPLAKSRPEDQAVLLALARAQDARGEILSFADDSAGAAQSLEASSRTYDQLLATSAASPALYFEAGSVIDTLGDVMGQDTGFADADAALRDYRRAIEFDQRALTIDPTFMRVRRGLVTMQLKVGNVELDTAPAMALNDFRGAMAKLEALPEGQQSRLDVTRTRAVLLRKQAFALSQLGRFAEADPLFDASTSIYQKIAAADPQDVRALGDLDRLLTNEAASYEDAADPLLAAPGNSAKKNLAAVDRFEVDRAGVLRRLLQRKPEDVSLQLELASVTVVMDALRSSSGPSDANSVQRDRTALRLLGAAVADNKSSTMQLDLAFNAFTKAEPDSLRDPSVALHCAQRGVLLTHRKDPLWLLNLAQAYRASGDTAQAASTAKDGLALLTDDAADQTFRLRKLLQSQLSPG